eukprot:362621-Chlamydomonas_euryale.AAC.2
MDVRLGRDVVTRLKGASSYTNPEERDRKRVHGAGLSRLAALGKRGGPGKNQEAKWTGARVLEHGGHTMSAWLPARSDRLFPRPAHTSTKSKHACTHA